MAENDLLTRVLQACAQAAPAPFFPADFAASSGLPRQDIDAAIDRLRLNGYLQIVDWVQGKGQGYAPTPAGRAAREQPIELRIPAAAPEPEQPMLDDRIWQRGETVRNALLQPGPPIVTMTLLFANLAMFAVGLAIAWMRGIPVQHYLSGTTTNELSAVYESLGSLVTGDVIVHQQWWRLISYQFMHIGLAHLGMNMLSLYILGPLLEGAWGSKRFLALYLVSGFTGGAAVVVMDRQALGASGSISGLLTSIGAWLWLNRDCLPQQVTSQMLSRVGINLLLLVGVSLMPHVSWEGHLGGALGGALLSVPLHYQRFGQAWQRFLSWLGFVLIPLGAVALAYLVHARERAALVSELQFGPAFQRAEKVVLAHYNGVIVPLFDRNLPKLERDPVFLKKARAACAEVAQQLRPLLDELVKEAPPKNSAKVKEMEQAHTYFQAWSELFQILDHFIQDSKGWNPARLEELNARVHAVFDLRKPLESNTVLPRLPSLVPNKNAPNPPAKLPADTG